MLCAQSCLTLCDPVDCSPPGSSVMDSPGKNTGVGCHPLLQGLFLTQGSNPYLLGLLLAGGFFTTTPPGKPWVDTQRCAASSSGLGALFWAQCPLAEQELFHQPCQEP